MTAGTLEAGREALTRYEWAQGFDLLNALDDPAELNARDLELLGEAAFWTSRPQDFLTHRNSPAAVSHGLDN